MRIYVINNRSSIVHVKDDGKSNEQYNLDQIDDKEEYTEGQYFVIEKLLRDGEVRLCKRCFSAF